jgi:hypothetical protein
MAAQGDVDAGLDGVCPPPGIPDPVLVVWRRYGNFRDRLPMYPVALAVCIVLALITELTGVGKLDITVSYGIDAFCVAFAIILASLMTSRQPARACSST